ncbi:unnamed protein product, partial [Rotaria sp. Silwood1]
NEIEENEDATSVSIARGLRRKKVEISSRTVRRRLKAAGYRFSTPLSKPLLTTLHKQQCLRWARLMQHQDWNKTVFSDESKIRSGLVKRRYWQRKGLRKVVRTTKHPAKINVWGCFARNGFGEIVCFPQDLTSKYLCSQIYAKALRHSTRPLFGRDRDFKLLKDSDPKHKSKQSKEWKRKNGIDCLPFLACSPNINPAENLWNILKIRVAMKKPNNVPALFRLIKQEWKKLPLDFWKNLVESMEKRVDALILAEGDYTM